MDQQLLLGIDFGGTKILAGVATAEGEVLGRAKTKTKAEEGPLAVVRRIAETAREAMVAAQVTPAQIVATGIGAPGPLDPARGMVLEAPNLGWKDVPLSDMLHEQLGLWPHLSNDVNAGTWGEYALGAGRGAHVCLGVFVGTGIGGGIVIDGKLFEGATGQAGEIGHVCIDLKGPVCGCGRRGCMEAFASRSSISREIWQEYKNGTRSKQLEKVEKGSMIRSKQLAKGLLEKDKLFTGVIDRATQYVGIGLAAAAHLLNPDRIVLGGGVVEALGDAYVDRVRVAFTEAVFPSIGSACSLVEASLGDDAALLGSALLARDAAALATPQGD